MEKRSAVRRISFLLLWVLFLTPLISLGETILIRAENQVEITIHYQRTEGDYEDWNIWLWEKGGQGRQIDLLEEDEFGKVARFKGTATESSFGFIVCKGSFEEKDTEADRFFDLKEGKAEIWLKSGDAAVYLEEPKSDPAAAPAAGELQLRIHYRRFDGKYEGWNLWLWPKGGEGMAHDFSGEDDYGKVATVSLDAGDAEEMGFIVRKGEWEAKDVDMDRFISLKEAKDGVLEVYLLEKDPNLYYALDQVDLSPKILKAELTTVNKIKVNLSVPMTLLHDQVEGLTVRSERGDVGIQTLYFSEGGRPESSSEFEILLKEPLTLGASYTLLKEGYGEKEIMLSGVFSTKAFENAYHFEGSLGAIHEKDKTTFRLWTPTATKVILNLFENGDGGEALENLPMELKDKGVWELELPGDHHGVYYTYTVENNGSTQEAVDPYAKGVGVNGLRAMVVDMERTDPEGWTEDEKPLQKDHTDAVIYELHVRDLSISEDSGIENKGKFLGLTEMNTKGPDGVSTGLSHLVDLGITHLHLLPAFDFRSIDETKLQENNFNWGYDPQHFNVPEGSYSTDPYKGEVRIREFKEMVMALHENDIRVVMDVVYNHTGASGDSDFSKIVPGYYYRYNADGTFSNGSGTGNETASERSMMRKYIVDSVVHWATEYGVDGFRFDLMALHDIETMKAVRAALDEIDPSILIYGEGWTGGDSPLPDKEKALKRNTWRMEGIAAFSDDLRDGIKGHVFTDEDRGFVNGEDNLEESVKFGIVASLDHPQVNYKEVKYSKNFWAKEPDQTISYVEAHDNLTLWDKLALSNVESDEEERIRMHRLANAVVLTSQGIPFLHAGSEFLREKGGNHNSYNSPDEVNRLEWERKSLYLSNVEYIEGLIQMRKAHPAFHMDTAEDIRENLSFLEMPEENMIGYILDGEAVGDEWQEILVVMNANETGVTYTPEKKNWKIMADGEKVQTEAVEVLSDDSFEVPAQTLLVLVRSEAEESPGAGSENQGEGGSSSFILVMLLGAGLLGYTLHHGHKLRKIA